MHHFIGWYHPLDWHVFNFTDGKNISRLGYVDDATYAAYWVANNSNKNWSSYVCPDIGIPANFTVEDYEVFQVT